MMTKLIAFAKKWTLPLAIWVAYTYLSPVISIAPSSYILFRISSTRGSCGKEKPDACKK